MTGARNSFRRNIHLQRAVNHSRLRAAVHAISSARIISIPPREPAGNPPFCGMNAALL